MNKLSKQVAAIEAIASQVNNKYFDNKLPSIAITLQGGGAGSAASYGWFWAERWVSKNEKIHELNITAENIDNILQLYVTMHHELIHLYAKINNIQDTSRQGRWHNKEFKKLCETHGLSTSKEPSIGITTRTQDQSKDYVEWVTEASSSGAVAEWVTSGDVFKRLPKEKKEKKEKTSKTYECKACGEKFSLKIELVETMNEYYCPYCGTYHSIEESQEEHFEEE